MEKSKSESVTSDGSQDRLSGELSAKVCYQNKVALLLVLPSVNACHTQYRQADGRRNGLQDLGYKIK